MIRAVLLLLALASAMPVLAEAQTAASPAPAAAAPAAPPAITQSQAEQTLAILKDDQQRGQLIQTLETIAKAQPAAHKALPVPLKPGSLGAEVLFGVRAFFEHLTTQSRAAFRTLSRLPDAWEGITDVVTDPEQRALALDALWRLAAVMSAGLATEWAIMRLLGRPRAVLLALAPAEPRRSEALAAGEGPTGDRLEHGHDEAVLEHEDEEAAEDEPGEDAAIGGVGGGAGAPRERRRSRATAWLLLRRLPLALARLVLELIPVAGFTVMGHLLVSSALGGPELERLILLSIVNAYAVCRGLIALGRMMLSPDTVRLRLFAISDASAAYGIRWLRRLVVVSVFGYAAAEAGLLLGVSQEAHDAILKMVGLAVHIMLIVVVIEKRDAIGRRFRAAPGSHGAIAGMRNRLAMIWHWIAVFYLAAGWLVWAVELPNGSSRLLAFIAGTLGMLLLARLVLIVVLGLLDRATRDRRDEAMRRSIFGRRVRTYRRVLRLALTLLVYALTLIGLLELWGFGTFNWLATRAGEHLVTAIADLGLTFVIAFVAWEAANAAIERRLSRLDDDNQAARSARLRTLLPLLRSGLLFMILAVVGLTILSEIGINIAPLLAGAGVIGVAVGFGSQKLVQDVITGLFLLLENSVQVGDIVSLAGLSGVVEHLSIRSITLRAEDGSVHVIPFSAVTTVTNMTRDFGYAVIEASVAYKDDYDDVISVLRGIVTEMRQEPRWSSEIRDDLEVQGIDKFADSAVVIKVRIRCGPFGRWSVAREFRRRMKARFDENGIEIPFPHQKLILDRPAVLSVGDRKAAE